jgi:hypothetical protein
MLILCCTFSDVWSLSNNPQTRSDPQDAICARNVLGHRGAITVPESSLRTCSFEMPPLIPVRVDLLAERHQTTDTERPTYELDLWRSYL